MGFFLAAMLVGIFWDFILGFFGDFFGIFLGSFWDFILGFFGIFSKTWWDLFWDFFGIFFGIFYEMYLGFFGIFWDFLFLVKKSETYFRNFKDKSKYFWKV